MAKKDKKAKKAAKKEAKSKAAAKIVSKTVSKKAVAKKPAPKPVAKPAVKKTVTPVKATPKPKPKTKPKAKAAPAKPAPIRLITKPVKKATKPAPKPIVVEKAPEIKKPIGTLHSKAFIATQMQRLIELRDHILDQMHGVAQDTLRVKAEGSEASAFGMHQADAGSDAYDKDFALSLLSQEQDALYEIEEALKRIQGGTYGVCEMSNEVIPKVRLEAIPHARFTVKCQAQMERENKGRRRWDTVPQFMDSADALVDEDDDGAEEDDRRKEKD